jgi:hypothetical protein
MQPAVTTLPLVHFAFEIVASTCSLVMIVRVCSFVSQFPTIFAPALSLIPKIKVWIDVSTLTFGDRYCRMLPDFREATLIESFFLSSHITAFNLSEKMWNNSRIIFAA